MSRNAFEGIERDYAASQALREHAAMERAQAVDLTLRLFHGPTTLTAFSYQNIDEEIMHAIELDKPPLYSEIDRLRRALARIAALEPATDPWHMSNAFYLAQDIAAEALTGSKSRLRSARWRSF